jgi:hypothetical protein
MARRIAAFDPRLPLLTFILVLGGCANRPSIAIRATVETFYSAVHNANLPLIDDNTSSAADPAFRQHTRQAAEDAQSDPAARASVQITRVDQPVISGSSATVRVQFADGRPDTVVLVREGLRWRIVSSGRLH